jgi:DNA segregation ATPase FtsK/SpoIIIE-like protein
MKKVWNKWITMIAATFFVSMLNVTVSMAHDGGVSLQVFYDELQPYGTWIAYENYGYVWRPRVDRDFVPYATDGYWINTEYGNTWVSDYGWGWAPFHYGRWFYDDFYGWMWAPDTVWGPAWVAWRSGGGYYGWAPLMPGITVGVSYNYYDRIPDHYWSFVPCRYITYRTVYRHCVPRPQVITIIHQTTVVTHHYTDSRRRTYFTGPSRREIERVNNTRVPVYAVNDRSRPGRTEIERDRVNFYKPEINNDRESRAQSIPSRIERRDRRSTTDLRNGLDDNAANRSAEDRRREVRDQPTRRSETNREEDVRNNERTRETENVQRGGQEQERERNQSLERVRQQQDQKPLDRNDLRQSSDKQNREREDARRQQEARERIDRDNDNRRAQEERVRDRQRQQDQQREQDQQRQQQQQQERMQERQRQQEQRVQEQQRQQQQQERVQDQQRQQEQRVHEQQRQQERVQQQQRQPEQRMQQQRQEQQQVRQQRMTQPERQAPSRSESPRENRGNGSRRRD